jgi:hypothetical protein
MKFMVIKIEKLQAFFEKYFGIGGSSSFTE